MGEVARDNNKKKTEQMSMHCTTEGLQFISCNTSCLNYIFLAEFDICNLMCPYRGTQRGYSSKPLNIALLNVF